MSKPSASAIAQAFGFKDEQCMEYKQRSQHSQAWIQQNRPAMIAGPAGLEREAKGKEWEDGITDFIAQHPQLFQSSQFSSSPDSQKKQRLYAHYHLVTAAKRIQIAEQNKPQNKKRRRDIYEDAVAVRQAPPPPSPPQHTYVSLPNEPESSKNYIIVYWKPNPSGPDTCHMIKYSNVQAYQHLLTCGFDFVDLRAKMTELSAHFSTKALKLGTESRPQGCNKGSSGVCVVVDLGDLGKQEAHA